MKIGRAWIMVEEEEEGDLGLWKDFLFCGLTLATQKIIYPGLSCKLERDKSQTTPLTTLLLYLYKPASNGNGSITVDMQNKMYYISSISFVTSCNLGDSLMEVRPTFGASNLLSFNCWT